MKLRVNSKFRGELSLPSIGFSVIKNNPLDITPEQYFSEDVQLAIANKWLLVEDYCGVKKEQVLKTPVRNLKNTPVSAGNISFLPGETKYLTEKQLSNQQVQDGLSLEWLEQLDKEKKIPVVKVSMKKEKKIKFQVKSYEEDEEEIYRPEEPTTTMQAWDGRRKKLLNKEEIKKAHFKEAKGYVPKKAEGVQVGDIDFNSIEEETQPVEPVIKRGRPITGKGKKGRIQKEAKIIVSKKGGRKPSKPNTLKPVGEIRPERKTDDDISFNGELLNETQGLTDVDFVDVEQSQERISKHPVLSKIKSTDKRPSLDDKIKIDL